jgi:prolyl oligopeptidase
VYQGIPVEDPYRNLEKLDDAEVRRWVEAQAAYTRRTLDRIPALAKVRARVEALDRMMAVHVTAPQRVPGDRVLYLKRKNDEPLPKLIVRDKGGNERTLFDPDEGLQRGGKREALGSFAAAPDGRLVALVAAPADAELGVLRVRDAATGRDVGEPIPSVWGELPATWDPDGRRFYYTRNATGDAGAPFSKLRMTARASAGGMDVPVFGWQVDGAPAAKETDWPALLLSAGSAYAVGVLQEGVNSPLRLYVAPRERLGTAAPGWRPVVEERDGVRAAAAAGRWLYVRTFTSAPRFRVLRFDLAAPAAAPVEVVAQQRGVIEQIAAARGGFYYVVRDNAVADLYFLAHGSAESRKVASPYRAAIDIAHSDPDLPGVLVALGAWTRRTQFYRADADGMVDTGLVPPDPFGGGDDLVAEETTCDAPGGVRVPVSIIGRTGFRRDGMNPLLLDGYGGYGVTATAYMDPTWRAWYELGGLIAVANPRGSGAYGEEWYQAGRGPTKPNTWKDMIACAEALIARKYTSTPKLGIVGTSMGGVAAGRAVTERPELFGVAFLRVGTLDIVRMIEATPNGPNHELELGSLATAAGVRQLLAMSSYHHVKARVRYPAVMVTTGLNDNRVTPWIPIKMAARLQAASAGERPVLLRVEDDGGHGVTSTVQQQNAEWADRIAFHLWTAGDPAFQPR